MGMSSMVTPEMVKLAAHWAELCETKTRENGAAFVTVNADMAHPFKAAIYAKHYGAFPSDRLFALAKSVVDDIGQYEGMDLDEAGIEWAESEVPIYNTERTAWLAEDVNHGEYVNEALREIGAPDPFDIFAAIGSGIFAQARDMWDEVARALAGAVVGDEPDDE